MANCNTMNKSKWDEEHVKLHFFTGKVDKASMKAPIKGLRLMVQLIRKSLGIPGIFRLEVKVAC